jgi:histidinol-phosphatase
VAEDLQGLLDEAVHLTCRAGEMTLQWFRTADLVVETKADDTPVTAADRAAERFLREELVSRHPGDGIVGEEEADRPGTSGRRWVVDPIDGTKNFVRGVPVWATLIALMDGDEVVAGLVSAPALNRRWWAGTGSGAYTGKSLSSATRMAVSKVDRLSDASLSYSSLSGWHDLGREDAFLGLTRDVWRNRAYGDFWSYMLVAEGGVDIATEPEVALHDLAAPSIVVTEAGGRFTDLDGTAGPAGGSAVATNALLHDEVVRRLTP